MPAAYTIFRREIQGTGKDLGDGTCVVVDWEQIHEQRTMEARAAGLGPERSEQIAREAIRGCIVHELCHALERGEAGADDIREIDPENVKAAFYRMLCDDETPQSVQAAPKPLEPWQRGGTHDIRFIHACGLFFGKLLPVNPLRFEEICRTDGYGLSEPKRYIRAMEMDGDFNAAGTIREALDRGPGDVLTARWREDVFNWFRLSPKTAAHMEAAEKALALCHAKSQVA